MSEQAVEIRHCTIHDIHREKWNQFAKYQINNGLNDEQYNSLPPELIIIIIILFAPSSFNLDRTSAVKYTNIYCCPVGRFVPIRWEDVNFSRLYYTHREYYPNHPVIYILSPRVVVYFSVSIGLIIIIT